jgi:predicted Zn-ribbon and HTH transcriptional regulator
MNKNTSPSSVEVADIFELFGAAYQQQYDVPLQHLKAMSAIKACRTSALGGHKEECDANCGYTRISYNSCRNRHCPKCQTAARERWLFKRKQELLPIVYYHVVFTIPDDLNPIARINQKVVYNILFRAASETLLQLGLDHKHLGAQLGIIALLHTWGQTMIDHLHLHCIVTGGGLSRDGTRWVRPKKSNGKRDFFIHVNIISALFKKKFMAYLVEAYKHGDIKCVGSIAHLSEPKSFNALKRKLYDKKWVTYCKNTARKPEKVIEYLGRYTHRVAISNSRIVAVKDDRVTFKWRDYKDDNRNKLMSLHAFEFIRRFLLHILPSGFFKIRYYGLLSCRNHKTKLQLCRKLLHVKEQSGDAVFNLIDALFELTGIDITLCPQCGKGHMRRIAVEPRHRASP